MAPPICVTTTSSSLPGSWSLHRQRGRRARGDVNLDPAASRTTGPRKYRANIRPDNFDEITANSRSATRTSAFEMLQEGRSRLSLREHFAAVGAGAEHSKRSSGASVSSGRCSTTIRQRAPVPRIQHAARAVGRHPDPQSVRAPAEPPAADRYSSSSRKYIPLNSRSTRSHDYENPEQPEERLTTRRQALQLLARGRLDRIATRRDA